MADFGRKAPQKSSAEGAPGGAGGCVISALNVVEGDEPQELLRALGLDDALATAVPAASGSHEAEDADAALVEVLLSLPEDDAVIFADLMAELRQADDDEAADEDAAIEEDEDAAEGLFGAGAAEVDEEKGQRRGISGCRWIGRRGGVLPQHRLAIDARLEVQFA